MYKQSTPLISGVLLTQYKSIRETITSIVIETLFEPAALRKYFSGKNKKVREMLRVGKLLTDVITMVTCSENCYRWAWLTMFTTDRPFIYLNAQIKC